MPIGAIVSGAVGLIGSSRAASAQKSAARDQQQTAERQYAQTRADLGPYRQAGTNALNALMFDMGIGPAPTFGGSTPAIREIAGQAATIGGLDPQFNALRGALGVASGQGGSPTRFEVGGRTFNSRAEAENYARSIGTPGQTYGGFAMSPYENWTADQGRRAVEASAAARGGLFSGSTLNAVGDRQQQIAGGFRENYLNRLMNLGTIGQNAAAQTGAAGQTMAGQVMQAQGNAGNAAAAGWAGMSNAITGGIQNWQGQRQYNDTLNMYRQANGLTGN